MAKVYDNPAYIASCSFGKDSIATILLALEHDEPLDADRDATDFVSQKMLIRREMEWATKFFKAGIWGTEIAGAEAAAENQAIKWDMATSNPIKDITDAGVAMAGATGYKPNTLVLSPYAFNALKNHEDIKEIMADDEFIRHLIG